jgi:hypothetical protein
MGSSQPWTGAYLHIVKVQVMSRNANVFVSEAQCVQIKTVILPPLVIT